jgi:hypothetical protein
MTNAYLYLLIFLVIVSLILIFIIYAFWNTSKSNEINAEVSRQNAHRYYLNVIRREFSAQIISKDRMLFSELERKAEAVERNVSKMSNNEFDMEIKLMWNKYPQIMDFDFIGQNNGEYLSFFEYSSTELFWEDWDDSEQKLIDDWSRNEYNRNIVRDNYLDLVKYSALIIRFVSTIHHPDYEFSSDISTGTDLKKMLEIWEEEHGPYYGRKKANLKS